MVKETPDKLPKLEARHSLCVMFDLASADVSAGMVLEHATRSIDRFVGGGGQRWFKNWNNSWRQRTLAIIS